ncbi:MAG TPA: hypothetical protein VIM88_03135 [Sulfurovum sp.]|uniref:hypothetical protein n=1 Tax=Sulfurovum sp. TaxID=1969726 RepID=UPI002F928015
MKKFILTSVATAALLTSAQAEFNFEEMFKDMKVAALTLTKDNQDVPAQTTASENSQEAVNSVSSETQNSEDASKSVAER